MSNLDIVVRAQNLAGASLGQVEDQLGRLEQQSGLTERGMGMLSSAMRVGLVAAAAAATAALYGIGQAVATTVTTAADFESQINILSVAAGKSGTSMADLSRAAILVGADTELVGISASQAADAMTNFYKAGLDTAQTMGDLNSYLTGNASLTGALRAAIDLTAASELELADASEVVAVAMATYGMSAEDASGIADIFVRAADASVTSVGKLSKALINVGPIASGMGMSLEETNTALAILSSRGVQGREAGTDLKSMLMNMQRPADNVTEALAELNVELYNSEGRMKSLPEIIGLLQTAMAGMTMEQKNYYGAILASHGGIGAFNTLIGAGVEGWNAMTESMRTANTAQSTAAARTKGFNAAVEQLQGSLEGLMIVTGIPLLQLFLTPMIAKVTDLVGSFILMAPTVEQVQASYDKLATSVNGFLGTINAIFGPLVSFIDAWVDWSDVLVVLGGVALYYLVPALVALGLAIGVVSWPILALIATVALLRNAWEANIGGIQEKTAEAMEYVRQKLIIAEILLRIRLPQALEVLKAKWDLVWSYTTSLAGPIIATLSEKLEGFRRKIGVELPAFLESFREKWASVFDSLKAFFTRSVDLISPKIESMIAWFKETIPEALNKFRDAWNEIWAGLGIGLTGSTEGMSTGITTIRTWFSQDLPGVLERFRGAWDRIVLGAKTAWGFLVDFFSPTIERIKEAFPLMIASFEPIGGKLQELWAVAGPVLLKIHEIFAVAIRVAVKLFGEAIALVMPHVGTVVGLVLDFMIIAFGQVNDALNFVTKLFSENWPAIVKVVEDSWANIKAAWSSLTQFVSDIGTDIYDLYLTVKDSWDRIESAILETVGALITSLLSLGTNLSETLTEKFTSLKDFLGSFSLPNPLEILRSTISSIIGWIVEMRNNFTNLVGFLAGIRLPNPLQALYDSVSSILAIIQKIKDLLPTVTGSSSLIADPSLFSTDSSTGYSPLGLPLFEGPAINQAQQPQTLVSQISVNLYDTIVSSELDIEELAWKIASIIQRRQRQ